MIKTNPAVAASFARVDNSHATDLRGHVSPVVVDHTQVVYQDLFNCYTEAVCILDEQGCFLDVNDATIAMYGYPKEFFIGKNWQEFAVLETNDPSSIAKAFAKALNGKPQVIELRGSQPNGEALPGVLRLTPTRMNGRPAVIVIARDITEQKQTETQLQRLNRLYAVLNAISEFIIRCHDSQTLFQEACRIAVEKGGFRMAWIGLMNPGTNAVQPVAHSGKTGNYLEHLRIKLTSDEFGRGPTASALREGNHVVSNDIANDERMAPWRDKALKLHFLSSAAFPFRVAGEFRGVLSLYSDTVEFFDIEEIRLLERLSNNISFGLEVIHIETVSKVAEENLRIKERALSTSINGIAMTDLNGKLTYVNQAFLELWGYQNTDDVIGRPMDEFCESSVQAEELVRQLFLNGSVRTDLCSKRKDGSLFTAQLTANLVTDLDGKPLCMQGAFIDITERKTAEKKMQWDREQQATLREMLETVLRGGTLEQTLDHCLKKVLEVSWLSILPKGGIFLVEESRQTLKLVVSRDLSSEIMSLCARVPLGKCHCGRAATTKQMQFSSCVDHRHEISYPGMGEHGHYNMPLISEGQVLGVMVLYLPHGFKRDPFKEQFLSSVTDILAGFVRRKLHEDKLRLSDAVIKSTHDGVVITDLERTILHINPSFKEITGYSPEEALGQTPKLLYSQRHDEAFYQQLWKSVNECGYWQGEIWNRRKNGEIYPEWLTLSAVRDENGEVVNYVGVFSDISKVKQVEEKLERLAHYDALTNLPNRLLLQSRLKHAIEQARRDNRQLAVLFLDLDRFKQVNDSLGHVAGDELLQIVAKRFRRRLREVDTLARLGGDEFVILLEQLKDAKDAANVAQILINLIKEPIYLSNGKEVYVGASVGISIFPEDGQEAEELIRNADTAMYQAKEQNRGTYHLYTEAMTRRVEQKLDMEARLRSALTRNELVIHYQPLVSISNSQCSGVEALVRWNDPQEGKLIAPGDFISLAEETGLILPLGDWVLRTACRQMKAWQDAGLALETLAINLSPTQFKQPDIDARIAACLRESGLRASCLELEITESAIMDQGPDAVAKLTELKRLGVRLAIDDFGTGYSSLAYLKDFPIDKLKIDQSFVREILTNPAAAEIVAIIITMAKTLNLESLAEGVEFAEQLGFLKSRGCDSCQGYFFSRPVPAESIPFVLNYGKKKLILDAVK
jgi:diguanylate cyclase (GGDEF)-like protein/PAS domain S-box-containing protein